MHFVRNVLGQVCKQDRNWVVSLLWMVTEVPTLEEARQRLEEATVAFAPRYPRVAALLEDHGEEILAVYALPEGHRKRMRSTNMLERFNQELRRRTRVGRIFPNAQACLRLVCALAMEISDEWLERRYLRMEEPEPLETHADEGDLPLVA